MSWIAVILAKDKRLVKAAALEKQAKALRDEAEAERIADFPKVGDKVRVKGNGTRLVFGFHNKSIWGVVGKVIDVWPEMGTVTVTFPSVAVKCKECGQETGKEKARLNYPEEVEKVT